MTVLDTLFLPFKDGLIPPQGDALFLGARPYAALRTFPTLTAWQPFYPYAKAFNPDAAPDAALPSGTWDTVLVNAPKQADQAKGWLLWGLERTRPGGQLIAAAANDANGSRLEKWFGDIGLAPSMLSKNHAKVVWATVPDVSLILPSGWENCGARRSVLFADGYEYLTQPGIFSWDRLDAGTALLLQHLPQQITGVGADFGCGLGVLSRNFSSANSMTEWHALDADALALSCARENLSAFSNIHLHWADLTAPQKNLPPLDVIVMNPPFHAGKSTDAAIGQDFIRMAAHHLKSGGRLVMVANAHLPYEKMTAELFSSSIVKVQQKGFKIIEAVK